jgi:hypothetical protein
VPINMPRGGSSLTNIPPSTMKVGAASPTVSELTSSFHTSEADFVASLSKFTITEHNSSSTAKELLRSDHILELVVSGITDAKPLRNWLLAALPKDLTTFKDSIGMAFLLRLSKTLLTPLPFQRDVATQIMKDHLFLEAVPRVAMALMTISHSLDIHPVAANGKHSDPENDEWAGLNVKIKRQSKQKGKPKKVHIRTKSQATTVDYQSFKALGYEIPTSSQDVLAVAQNIGQNLEGIANVCIVQSTSSSCSVIHFFIIFLLIR